MLLRAAALCVVLAGVEALHGIARTVWVAPRLGKALATKLSVVSGSVLAFAVCWWLVPGVGLRGTPAHLGLGLGLAAFMAAFDLFIGRVVMRLKWARLWRDFNPASGNLLSIGLALLVAMPAVVERLRAAG